MSQVFTISAGSEDCWGSSDYDLVTGNTVAYLGGTNNFGFNVRNWIPFHNVNLPKGILITSAFVNWTATEDRSAGITANIGCESAVNPSVPSSLSDLNSRVQSSAKTYADFEAYITGNRYSYNITTAVQEILNNSGWSYGAKLAVLVVGISDADHRRRIATVENVTYQEPTLEITIPTFFPRSGGVI